MKWCNPTQKIYQTKIPREYILSHLDKNERGKLSIPNDIKMINFLDTGKTIGESITLVSNNSSLPIYTKLFLCKRYVRIIKMYMHEYNLTKNRKNQ